jgi:Flp pilus assembly protein TadG
MITAIKNKLTRFRNEESGNMTIEFVLAIPLVFSIFLSTTEMGIYSMRQMFLDRGVDMAVRNVRLNTGQNLSHTDLRNMVCNFSGFLRDCESELNLTLTPIEIDSFTGPSGQPSDCVNTYPTISPLRQFAHGSEHQMMLIVACYSFDPIFPTTGLGFAFDQETDQSRMYGFSGFVQEPS